MTQRGRDGKPKSQLPKTRRQAFIERNARYYTGEPCVNGHREPRYATTGQCVVCAWGTVKAWREANPEKHTRSAGAHSAEWREKNRERLRIYNREYQRARRAKAKGE